MFYINPFQSQIRNMVPSQQSTIMSQALQLQQQQAKVRTSFIINDHFDTCYFVLVLTFTVYLRSCGMV